MNKPDKIAELQFMYDWINVINEYIVLKYPEMKQFEDMQKQLFKDAYDKLMNKYNSRDFQGFKQAYNDTNEQFREMRRSERVELNQILMSKFGKGIEDIDKEVKKKITQVLKRGKIKDHTEFYLITEYLSDTSIADPNREQLGQLILTFEMKTASKASHLPPH